MAPPAPSASSAVVAASTSSASTAAAQAQAPQKKEVTEKVDEEIMKARLRMCFVLPLCLSPTSYLKEQYHPDEK
jgi:ribosomal protein L12E/L44/L45/RPP1/RPP2